MRSAGRILLLLIILLATSWNLVTAQTPVFSQYYATGLYLNPALAGIEKPALIGLNYRSQWASVNVPYRTFQITFIQPLIREGIRPKHLGGWGISALNDVAGPNQNFVTQSISLSGAYNIQLNRRGNNLIAIGGQVSALQQKVNTNALRWSSQYSAGVGFDPSMPGENGFSDRVFSPVFNAGAVWYFTEHRRWARRLSIFQGASISNINQPTSFYMDKSVSALLYRLHGGMSIQANRHLEVSPNYLVQFQNDLQINIGGYISYPLKELVSGADRYTKVTIGTWYRVNDAIIFSAGFTTQKWNAAISYDTNASSMKRYLGNASATEISFAYKFTKYNRYPRFSSPLI